MAMRSLRKTLFAASFLCALASFSASRPASAEPLPERRTWSPLFTPASLSLATPRANVASLTPLSILPVHPALYGGTSARRPLEIAGFVTFGLGLATLAASGITGIVAAAETSRLDSDCPGKVCVEGSSGERSLNRALGAARATDWLLGIGTPVTVSGIVMLLYSAVVDRYGLLTVRGPVFSASSGGGNLTFHF